MRSMSAVRLCCAIALCTPFAFNTAAFTCFLAAEFSRNHDAPQVGSTVCTVLIKCGKSGHTTPTAVNRALRCGHPRSFSRGGGARGEAAPAPAHPEHRADGGAARPEMSTIAPPPMSTPTRPARPLPASVPYLPHDDVEGGSSLGDPTASRGRRAPRRQPSRAAPDGRRGVLAAHRARPLRGARAGHVPPAPSQALRTIGVARQERSVDAASADEDLDDRLARRVFMTLRRLATIERDDPLAPTLASRARMLTELGIVRAPQVLDVCAIYGPDNPRATSALTRDPLRILGPSLEDDLAAVGAIAAVDLERRARTPSSRLRSRATKPAACPPATAAGVGVFPRRRVVHRRVDPRGARVGRSHRRGFEWITIIRPGHLQGRVRGERTSTFGERRGGGGKGRVAAAARGALAAAADRIARETIPMIETYGARPGRAGRTWFDGGRVRDGVVRDGDAAAGHARSSSLPGRRRPNGRGRRRDRVDDDDDAAGDASMAGKIESLRALFPDHTYGDGYLALALDAHGGDAEVTAARCSRGTRRVFTRDRRDVVRWPRTARRKRKRKRKRKRRRRGHPRDGPYARRGARRVEGHVGGTGR